MKPRIKSGMHYVVWKYPLTPGAQIGNDRFILKLPKYARFLKAGYQVHNNGYWAWFLQEKDSSDIEKRIFELLATGESFSPKQGEEFIHMDTIIAYEIGLVYHLIEWVNPHG